MADRLRAGLLGTLFFVVCIVAVSAVGFCTGGLLGPALFGSLGGHGLADIGYLFAGALDGALVGLGFAVHGLLRWNPQRRFRAAIWLAGFTLIAGVAVVIADRSGAW